MKKKIESRTWKVFQNDLDREIAKREHFGWEFVSRSENEGGAFVHLVMKRDRRHAHYKRLKRLEAQANIIDRKFPVPFVVTAIIGLAFLIPWFFLMNNLYFLIFLIIALFMLMISFFILLVFLFTRRKKNQFLQELYDEGDEVQGKLRVNPLPENTLKPTKNTYFLKQYIYSLGKQKKKKSPKKKDKKK